MVIFIKIHQKGIVLLVKKISKIWTNKVLIIMNINNLLYKIIKNKLQKDQH
jgi:hypothetical protein